MEKYLSLDQKSQIINDLFHLAVALEAADKNRWMSNDHAKNIWRHHLTHSGMDVNKSTKKEVS